MKWYGLFLIPIFTFAQWSINNVIKISPKYTNSYALLSDYDNITFTQKGIVTSETSGWLTLLDVHCEKGFLFSHIFVDFSAQGNPLTIEVRSSENNQLLASTTLLENDSFFLSNVYEKNIDIWLYLPPHCELYSFGVVRKQEVPISSSNVIINPSIIYYPEGVLSISFSVLSPAWIEVELYNKKGDRLATLIPRSYYKPGPILLEWTPLSSSKPYLVSGSAYVYIRYKIPSGEKEWEHRFEIVYL